MGIQDIKKLNADRIINGVTAVSALDLMRQNKLNGIKNPQALIDIFEEHKKDLGFGLLLKKYTDDMAKITPQMLSKAVDDSIPRVTPMFWSFRLMVGMGVLMLILYGLCLFFSLKGSFIHKPWLLKFAMIMIPAPWIAIEAGWFVAEYGRQPWTVYGILPTHLSVSNIDAGHVILSLAGFVLFYTILGIVEVFLMVKYVRLGPASLGTGRYDGEKTQVHLICPSDEQGV